MRSRSMSVRVAATLMIALVTIGLIGGLPVAAASESASATTVTLLPVADAYVSSSYPTTNYGTTTTLRADGSPDVHSYLRFSVTGLGGSAINQASLRIYANSSSSAGLTASKVSDNTWGETTINYANMPPIGSGLVTSLAVASATWVSVDVTSYINAEGTFSFALTTPGSTAISLASRESGANSPQLVLSLGGSISSPTPTLATTRTATPTTGVTSTATSTIAFTNTPTHAVTATATLASTQSAIFNPVADAYVNGSSRNTNYGNLTSLRADESPNVYSYLRFTVSGLGGIPITQARLMLYTNSSSTRGLVAKSVSSNTWSETSITYANMPPMGTSLSTSPTVTAGTWVTLDVTSYVAIEGTYSFGLTTPDSTTITMGSRESGANAPKLVLSLGGSSTSMPPSPTTSPTASPAPSGSIQHVFVIVMENKSYDQIWNTSSTPYITQLGNNNARATNYYAITHPSLPNYLDLIGGSNYSITTDCNPSSSCHIDAPNLADSLETAGYSWKGYMESMPSPCYLTTSGKYAPKHNPFVYFDDIRTNSTRCNSHDVPYSALSVDLALASTTPNFAFISPDLCNDMHDCSISTGDTWLQTQVPLILNSPSCILDKCLVVVTFDEDDGSSGNHVVMILAGSAAKTGGYASAVNYNHYSLLRTIESIFGLSSLTANDRNASLMTEFLR